MNKTQKMAASAGATLTKKDIAEVLQVCTKTIDRMVSNGQLPAPDLRISKRTIRWRPATIERFILGK